MSIESSIYAYLRDNTEVAALVHGRIYPLLLPVGYVLPALTYAKISGPRVNTKGGQTGLAHPRYQISCWGKTYAEAKTLSDTVRRVMNQFDGGTTYVQNEIDLYEEDNKLYHVPLDFIIWHEESI